MRLCGIEFDSVSAIVALVQHNGDGTFQLIPSDIKRIPVDNHEDSQCLISFVQTVSSLVKDFHIDGLAIRKCTYKGKYVSGAPAIKMEALLQINAVPSLLISPQAIAAKLKSRPIESPKGMPQYQKGAFVVAVLGLDDFNAV